MVRFVTNLSAALTSLREQRSRTILSAVGITVGSFAIVLLVGIAKGVRADVSREVSNLGVNLLIVLPARIERDGPFNPGMLGISYLSENDVKAIRTIPGVQGATPVTFVGSGMKNGERTSPMTLILATEPEWFDIRSQPMLEGRTFQARDTNRPVCVLGEIAKRRLFGETPAVGKALNYNGVEFEVLGVTRSRSGGQGVLSMGSFDNVAVVPYRYIQKTRSGAGIDRIFIKVEPGRDPKSVLAAVEATLGKRLARETFSVLTQDDLLGLVFRIMSIATWLLTGLTSIALVVGGLGIMTVMLMAVNERTKEIGIRKTVGARRADIFSQFLLEAMVLGLIGGLAGLGLSYLACLVLVRSTALNPLITLDSAFLGIGVAVAVGLVFGLIPAMRAATRDPIQSLRHE